MTVTICDVGPRDGLQNQPTTLAPEVRAELVNRLADAGLRRIEAVSFVNPKLVPQMAGAEEVVAGIERRDGVVYAGLALNERGYERLVAAGLDEVHFAFAATESFNRRNQNATVEESLAAAERIAGRAREDGIRATVTIGVAFGCPFEGASTPGTSPTSPSGLRRPSTRSSSPTPSASRSRGRSRASSAGRAFRGRRSASTCTTRATPATRTRSPRWRRAPRCSMRRSEASAGALRPAGDREHRDRGPRLPPPRRGHRDRDRPRGADRRRRMARGVLQRQLEGYVYRAGTLASLAG